MTDFPLAPFLRAFADSIAAALPGQWEPDALIRMMRLPDADHGDIALPCFELSKALKKAPPQIAQDVSAQITCPDLLEHIEAAGPYLNARFQTQALFAHTLPRAGAEKYGHSTVNAGKTAVLDFSSPNIAKPLAFHHIRSTVIGAALKRLHEATGYRAVGINYMGDWGKQFGLLATGFARHGDPERQGDAHHLVEVYVKANREADTAALKAKIQAPEDAQTWKAELERLRSAPAPEDKKDAKKQKKKRAGLEKKLCAARGLSKEQDPLENWDAFAHQLAQTKTEAEAALPEATARDQEARNFLKKMENGDPEALKIWKAFRDTSIEEFETVYRRMGIEFTHLEGESTYTSRLNEVVEQVQKQPGTEISEGAEIVRLQMDPGEPPAMLKTKDGTTLYLTRDIAAAQDRFARFEFDRSLYVVARDQSLHFKQLFRTLDAMGLPWHTKCHHIPFGRVHGMSTRRGNVVFLDEVLDEATKKAREICEASTKVDRARLDETAEAIGVGAIVFGDLVNPRETDYTFSWESALDFQGHTASYVQFSHARAHSILKKASASPTPDGAERLQMKEERALALAIARFPNVVRDAVEKNEPSFVARHLLEVAQKTASYLTAGNRDRTLRVICDDAETQRARLGLIAAVKNTLAEGLRLLGVQAPDAM